MADATNASDELYPIAVLIDELKVRRSRVPPPNALLAPAALTTTITTTCSTMMSFFA